MPRGYSNKTKNKFVPPSNKGSKFSDEHKKKMSLSHKGKIVSEETKQKHSKIMMGRVPWNKGKIGLRTQSEEWKQKMREKKGDKHWHWMGGCKEYWRNECLKRDNWTCQVCGLREVEIMEVDHIKPRSKYPELATEINNMVTLCPNCHRRKTIRERDWN